MDIKDLLRLMVENNASDLFYRAGDVPRIRIDGKVRTVDSGILTIDDLSRTLGDITTEDQRKELQKNLDIDFGLYIEELQQRFRVSIFIQRGTPSLVIRQICRNIQTFEELNLPEDVLKRLSLETRGLVLLTGSAGSGKSTTIASMIGYINTNADKHILTVEEPIEFTFDDKRSIINQREVGQDVSSYPVALRAFTLQSPDVIYIGNIRDLDTMSTAITAAETGVLVLSTLHTINAGQTVERVINLFPPHQHDEIRTQLSLLLKGVISLRLIPLKDKAGRIPAYEVMLLTPTIARLIRENKIREIPHFIEEGSIFGMQSFNQSLVRLVKENKVSEDTAVSFSDNKDEFLLALKGIKKV